jgi:mRNA-degrading endonuclease toxin of MazEF toxin-antitoxin module
MSERVRAGQIVLVDWRGDALPKEPNKLRPCIVVEDDGLFDETFPNILIVPLTDSTEFLIPSLTVTIDPTSENGCAKTSHAISHSITVASKKRVAQITAARITDQQLHQIRGQVAECIGFLDRAEDRSI